MSAAAVMPAAAIVAAVIMPTMVATAVARPAVGARITLPALRLARYPHDNQHGDDRQNDEGDLVLAQCGLSIALPGATGSGR